MVSCLIWVQYLVLNVHEQAFQEKACGLQLSKIYKGHLLLEEQVCTCFLLPTTTAVCVFPVMSQAAAAALAQSLHN